VGLNTPRIVLAEDNTDDEGMTLRALRITIPDARIEVVRDGQQAADRLTNCRPDNRPDLILLDIKMPKLSGLEVLQKIRNTEGCKHIPIIMLTSSDDDGDITRAYEYGANSYVRKPVASDAFLKTIAELGLYWTGTNTPPPN
jgi:two-component system, response regulator